jgi:hypothetical protein
VSFYLMFTNCKKERGSVKVKADVDPYVRFAYYADLLLTGQEIPVDLPGASPGAHVDQVSLHWVDELSDDEQMISTVFLVCGCHVPIEEKKRAMSPLLTPKQKLYLPKR